MVQQHRTVCNSTPYNFYNQKITLEKYVAAIFSQFSFGIIQTIRACNNKYDG